MGGSKGSMKEAFMVVGLSCLLSTVRTKGPTPMRNDSTTVSCNHMSNKYCKKFSERELGPLCCLKLC